MSTVYIPQTIESAEQAEALDAGTLLIHDRYAPLFVAEDEDGKTLSLRRGSPSYMDVRNAVGFTALVPVEARRQEPTDIFDPAFDAPPEQWSRRTHRYCTAWTEES